MADSEIDRLRHALAAAEGQLNEERQRAEEERQRAESADQRAEEERKRAEEERQRAETAEQLTKKTTFTEFIRLCHRNFTTPLHVEVDRRLTTKGSITSPRQKKHPTYLRPWDEFPQSQLQYFDAAYRLLSEDDHPTYFSPRLVLEAEGQAACARALTSEKDLEHYDRSAVEEKVQSVLRQLMSMTQAHDLTNGCTDVEFHNHLNALAREQTDNTQDHKRSRPSAVDQACLYRSVDGQRSLLLVREFKAAHKLSSAYLRAGLRPMAMREEVVLRATIPHDPTEKLQYHADRLVAAVVTQTFEYMIDHGLEYSSFSTGVAEVYLRVRPDDPETVYYYLTEPQLDVPDDDPAGFRYPFTAIGRLLGFSLMALHAPQRGQEWRRAAAARLHLWSEDFDEILYQIPDDVRRDSPEGSLYSSPHYPVDPRSPYLTRSRKVAGDRDAELVGPSFRSDTSSDGPEDAVAPDMDTPSRTAAAKRKRASTGSSAHPATGRAEASGQRKAVAYCTMKCLAGLRKRRPLDSACPNYIAHRTTSDALVHEIGLDVFADRVRAQLDEDADHDCDPLDIVGARGALFKVRLASHGYTFVAKGTVESHRSFLRHEAHVYDHLFPIQGSAIPVHLGSVDLTRPYFYDGGAKIVHMLFLSWGGHALFDQTPLVLEQRLEQEKRRSHREITQLGIRHNDWRLVNMLWNEELQRVLVIDFERADIQSRQKKRRHAAEPQGPTSSLNAKRRFIDPTAA